MHDHVKSDSDVVPAKPLNKAEQSVAEVVEGRKLTEKNTTSKQEHLSGERYRTCI